MFAQRTAARMSQRAAQQLRSAPRRFNSTGSGEKFPWAVDNSFNREREAVKHHANSTSGAFPSCPLLLFLELDLWQSFWVELKCCGV